MTTEEAINSAIDFEKKVRDLYFDYWKKTEDNTGKRILQVLGTEEQDHVNYLEFKLKQFKEKGRVKAEKIKTRIPSKERIQSGLQKLEKRITDKDLSNDLDLLKKALEMEKESTAFYKTLVGELKGEEQKLFSNFLNIEEGHQAIVQAEIDSIKGLGFWFDYKEFDLEAG